jgi:hypothetical protein
MVEPSGTAGGNHTLALASAGTPRFFAARRPADGLHRVESPMDRMDQVYDCKDKLEPRRHQKRITNSIRSVLAVHRLPT